MMIKTALSLLSVATFVTKSNANTIRDPAGDAAAACAKLNLTEQLSLMRGFGPINGYSRNSGCGGVCGRDTFRWDNGPEGFGDGVKPGTTTQFPSSLSGAATFDPDLIERWGVAMGEEFYNKGTNIQEGPGVNVARIQHNGRNFEYMSGEDPVLGSALLPRVVNGIQQNVMAITKHYIGNTQETDRTTVNEIVSEKLLMELYGPPFAAAVATSAGVMCAYNLVNGVYACENPFTLKTMLKGRYNFSGFVVSDWGACHSTTPSLAAGLDIEMPNGDHFSEANLLAAIAAGNVTVAEIADRCQRILLGYFSLDPSKRYPCGGGICINNNVSTPEHKALARELAAKATVLLKNTNGLLPLSKTLRIALIGPDAMNPYTGGQGSGSVVTNAIVSPFAALSTAGINITYEEGKTAAAAAVAAAAADVAIVFGHAQSGEGSDRQDLLLSGNIDSIIPAVAAANPKTVVYMAVPGAIRTDWRDSAAAILTTFLPGEQIGPALFDILFGDVPPQAKLPVTFPIGENDEGMTPEQYPGVPGGGFVRQSNYTEGLLIGYRWYEKNAFLPAFPFGHGLTYGTFSYSNLAIAGRVVSFTVTSTSGSGCDTPQLYLSSPSSTTDPAEPLKVLRYFQKTCTPTTDISFTITDADVSIWNVSSESWQVVPGTYGVSVGSSSADIRLTGTINV
jgi:beta-glucosidase